MCECLKIPRSTFYYDKKEVKFDTNFENAVIEEFRKSRKNYGTRKLKVVLKNRGIIASRKRIGLVMKKYNLVSNYTLKLMKKHKKSPVNEDKIENLVERKFNNRKPLEVVVSDLTYVNVAGKWNYICILFDLSRRKIIGSAVGKNKTAELVKSAFFSTRCDLRRVQIFHTDRGSEFKNKAIDSVLSAFKINRSLSKKGTPIDNSVCESMYSVVKTEFAFNRSFNSFDELEFYWFDYVNWYNNVRVHGSLGYTTPSSVPL